MKMHHALLILLLLVVATLLVGCIPGDGRATPQQPAGFFWGIWHGWVAPIALIISLFNREIGIYETYNTGLGYDFGFYMAIVSGFGGLSLSRKRRKHRDG